MINIEQDDDTIQEGAGEPIESSFGITIPINLGRPGERKYFEMPSEGRGIERP